jgi:hypothetical protein
MADEPTRPATPPPMAPTPNPDPGMETMRPLTDVARRINGGRK